MIVLVLAMTRNPDQPSNGSECLAQLRAFATEVWGSDAAAQRFLSEPHPLLRGRIPRELARESEAGAHAVERLLGGLKYGAAV